MPNVSVNTEGDGVNVNVPINTGNGKYKILTPAESPSEPGFENAPQAYEFVFPGIAKRRTVLFFSKQGGMKILAINHHMIVGDDKEVSEEDFMAAMLEVLNSDLPNEYNEWDELHDELRKNSTPPPNPLLESLQELLKNGLPLPGFGPEDSPFGHRSFMEDDDQFGPIARRRNPFGAPSGPTGLKSMLDALLGGHNATPEMCEGCAKKDECDHRVYAKPEDSSDGSEDGQPHVDSGPSAEKCATCPIEDECPDRVHAKPEDSSDESAEPSGEGCPVCGEVHD
ncbi:hypothetical protein ACFL2D_00030 [Patescibacteria group bacterium]